jgi:site-specific recombinase XerD
VLYVIYRRLLFTPGGAPTDLQALLAYADNLVNNSVRTSTRQTYGSAYRRYTQFTRFHELRPAPADERQILAFIAHLSMDGIRHTSIGVYLAAIRHHHLIAGLQDPI